MTRINILILIMAFMSCGPKDDAELSNFNYDLPPANPQGFLISEMQVIPAGDECPTKFGSRQNFIPLDSTKKKESLVTCFEYERIQPEADQNKAYESRFPEENETSGYDYSPETLAAFCKKNDLLELGADIITPDNKSANRKGPRFSCPTEGTFDEITEISVRNDPFDKGVFDMRTLKYFKNLKVMHLRTNAVVANIDFTSPSDLKMLFISITKGDSERRKTMLEDIARRMTEVEYVEIIFHDRYDGREILDAKFLSLMPKLKAVGSTVRFKNMKSLNGHNNLEWIELPYSEDTLDIDSIPSLKSIRYEADQGSNINSRDRKVFTIQKQVFTEYR